ncbi:hypothetical protein C1X69_01535 [Pseudomonas sp. FW305-67]|nr:hypothetical protein C1X70_13885 [Pseudomonas sp. FW305-53]PMY85125.1 hypothetical protein C1X68_21005 [Pseudomonas sp. FW303-C2]PMY91182.1 hypothetical protein C1X67_19980 [Pseudomonas sp. FW305-62]PNA40235.1 hypothetical protein C1X71_23680 [Pseudomonas sp. FW306-2-2C-A10BC]PNA89636.1 hypothetical protein C1X66_00250 [Pseudomonas sp. MPR-R3B]PNB24317.1 hypothetical protein C1X69_01535 [Pseudomonas sp. FW305-67]
MLPTIFCCQNHSIILRVKIIQWHINVKIARKHNSLATLFYFVRHTCTGIKLTIINYRIMQIRFNINGINTRLITLPNQIETNINIKLLEL